VQRHAIIDAVTAVAPDAGTLKCGTGRFNRDEIPALLDLHRQIIATR
jgi:hypothetical protein